MSLQLQNVHFAYGATPVLRDFSLSLAGKQRMALLGASGSGKSTLLRLIAGLERPQRGSIAWQGRALAEGRQFVPAAKRRFGMVFQFPLLFPHLTATENVRFGLSLPKREGEAKALHLLDRMGLAHKAKAYPHELSGGEQYRVALARTLAPEIELLLLDEPFAHLDSELRQKVMEDTIAILEETRLPSILVTHHPEEAMMMAEELVLLGSRGRILQHGSPGDLYREPTNLQSARMLGALNRIPAIVEHGYVMSPLGPIGTMLPEESECTLALRPEDVVFSDDGTHEAMLIHDWFMGAYRIGEIVVDGALQPLHVRIPLQHPAKTGEVVRFTISPASWRVFPNA